MFCNKCGKEIPDESLFCPFCGAKAVLEAEATPPPQNPEEPLNDDPEIGDKSEVDTETNPEAVKPTFADPRAAFKSFNEKAEAEASDDTKTAEAETAKTDEDAKAVEVKATAAEEAKAPKETTTEAVKPSYSDPRAAFKSFNERAETEAGEPKTNSWKSSFVGFLKTNKKFCIIGAAALAVVIVVIIVILALTSLGGTPLAKAYEDLSELAKDTDTVAIDNSEDSTSNDLIQYYPEAGDYPIAELAYNEDKDILIISIAYNADVEKIFEVLNKDIKGKDIGTIKFDNTVDALVSQDFLEEYSEGIGELSCSSMESISIDSMITEGNSSKWAEVLPKVQSVYFLNFLDSNRPDIDIQNKLDSLKTINVDCTGSLDIPYMSLYPNVERIVFTNDVFNTGDWRVTENGVELDENAAESETEAMTFTAGSSETSSTSSTSASSSEGGPVSLNYSDTDSQKIIALSELSKLKEIIIYPDSGYASDVYGDDLIYALQCVMPDLLVNKPDEAYSEGSLVPVSDIDTNNLTTDMKQNILQTYLKVDAKECYDEAVKFNSSSDGPLLNGTVFVYDASTASEEGWSGERTFSSTGSAVITPLKNCGITLPNKIGDYDTFAYIYATYNQTGKYTSGTKAYTKSLYVQVFDMNKKIAYNSHSVGSASAPYQFQYVVGSAPDKYSGTVSVDKAYEYIKGLKYTK